MSKETACVNEEGSSFDMDLETRLEGLNWLFKLTILNVFIFIVSICITRSIVLGYLSYSLNFFGLIGTYIIDMSELPQKQKIMVGVMSLICIVMGLGILFCKMTSYGYIHFKGGI